MMKIRARTSFYATLGLAATLALSACGHSDAAGDAASSDSVEMPAESALNGVESAAAVADSAATQAPTTTEGVAANAAAAAADVAAAAGEAPPPAATPSPTSAPAGKGKSL